MAIATTYGKNTLATAYGAAATHGALFTSAPGATPGTEVSGGSPAYARKPLTWSAPSNGVITAQAVFDVPACTVVGTGTYTAATAGTYVDGNTVTSTVFNGQDTVTVNFTYTQS